MPDPTPTNDPGKELLKRYEVAEDPDSTPPEPEPPAAATGEADTSGVASPTAASPAAPPSTPASVAATDAPKHPASLVKRARKLGFDDDDLADLSTDDLRDAVSDRAAARAAEDAAVRVLNAAGKPIDPVTKRFLPADAQPDAAPKADEFSLGMTRDELEAAGVIGDLHPVLQKLLAPLAAEIRALKADNAKIVEHVQSRARAEQFDALDREFVKHPHLYGEGSRHDLDPDSPLSRKRLAVIREMEEMATRGEKLPFAKAFAKAHAALFGDVAPPAPKPEPAAAPKPEANGTPVNRIGDKFKNGHALTPTDRVPPPAPKGRARAEAAVAKKIEVLTADDEDDAESLPD